MQPIALMNLSCEANWTVVDTRGASFGVGQPNTGVHGPGGSGISQTYFGGWDSGSHQLCIGKGTL